MDRGRVTAPVRAVLFDLDGTLADTEPLQWRAYREVLLRYGVDIGAEEYQRHWIATAGGAEYACRQYALDVSPARVKAEKNATYRALIDAGVPPRPGAVEAVERLRPTYRLAIATNSLRDETEVVLSHLGLLDRMHALVTREKYAEAKPAPDAYLTAAAAVGCTPAECVVVEDSQRGLASGLAAGMRVVVVPSDFTHTQDFTGCTRRIESLNELSPALLRELETSS